MAKFEFKLPDIGEGVAEGEIVNWLAEVGDTVTEDQDLVEVMTDKATVTIGAPKAGKLVELRGKPGDVVPVGGVLVVFEVEGGSPVASSSPTPAPAPAAQKAPADSGGGPVGDIKEVLPGMDAPSSVGGKPSVQPRAAAERDYFNEKPLAAPATRKLARELGVDLRRVAPSGKAGRVTPEDVERAGQPASQSVSAQKEPAQVAPQSVPAPAPAPAAAANLPSIPPLAAVPAQEQEERLPIRGLRRRIFENMARSKRTAAHFTYVDECEGSALKALRERLKPYAETEGVRLTFLPFIVKAVVAALKRHPDLNCLVDDAKQEIVRRRTYDLGIAMSTQAGLIVPVLRGADRLSILEIAKEIERLAGLAKDGKIQAADLGGSSFTITSLGKLGGYFATPIVNYPEVGILGIHEMKRRPVVKGDQIVIGEVMLLSLSFDHRLIDGHVGAAFAQEIISLLEDPERLLVRMV